MLHRHLRPAALLALGLAAGMTAGCSSSPEPVEQPMPTENPDPAKTEKKVPAHEQPGAASKPAHSSAIPGTENQLQVDQSIPGVTFSLASPTDDQVLPSGENVEVSFDLQNYRANKEIGQHVHVILDNNPYIAHYDPSEPLILENVSPGTHVLRAFPARHYHLSLKEGEVFDTVVFHVEEKTEDFAFDPTKPYATYSRPKGTYSQEAAQELLLDFYVTNATLGQDAKIIYGVDGQETELTEWKPVLLPPLAPGEHTITLKLVDMQGNLIENGGFNNTTRTITVE